MEKQITFLLFLMAALGSIKAQGLQIPNGGFDYWENTYNPVSWTSIDAAVGAKLGGDSGALVGLAYEDSVDFVQGRASLKLVADTVPIYPSAGVVAGVVSLGNLYFINPTFTHKGVPFIFRPDTVFFSYKYTSPGQDTAGFFIDLTKAGSAFGIRGLSINLYKRSSWTNFFVVLTPLYANNKVPDTLDIRFSASFGEVPVQGSTLHIDNVHFGYHFLEETTSPSGSAVICSGHPLTLNAHSDPAYLSYQWFLNGNPIPNASASTYQATDSGSYYVFIDSAGVPGKSKPIAVTVSYDPDCVSNIMDVAPGVSLNIYPNPASTQLNLTSDEDLSGFNVRLLDIVGRQISSHVLTGFINTINVSTLSAGTYTIVLTAKQGNVVAKNKVVVIR